MTGRCWPDLLLVEAREVVAGGCCDGCPLLMTRACPCVPTRSAILLLFSFARRFADLLVPAHRESLALSVCVVGSGAVKAQLYTECMWLGTKVRQAVLLRQAGVQVCIKTHCCRYCHGKPF